MIAIPFDRGSRHDNINSTHYSVTPYPPPTVELASPPEQYMPTTVVVDPNVNRLKRLVYRSLVGCGLVLVPTIVNMGLLYRWKGKEQGWLCFTICTVDGKLKRTPDIHRAFRG